MALVVGGALLVGCSTGREQAVTSGDTFEFVSPGGQTEIHYAPEERKPLAELAGPNVLDPDTRVSLDDFAGQVVAVNLWGQWCAPCRSEVDDLERLQEANKAAGFTVLGINLRDPNRQKPVDFIEDNEVTYPSIWDPSQAAVAALHGFPTSVVPSTLVLDREHRVAAVYLAEVSDVKLQPVLDDLLAEPGAGQGAGAASSTAGTAAASSVPAGA
ncbi:TlpA disulfide reductase family protein [Dietzia sp.]|uniref:TlpA disulfide reductase family protein n=1 Tax=Dietzia sp. TaxID=1871616 RepID=UPI002FDB9150